MSAPSARCLPATVSLFLLLACPITGVSEGLITPAVEVEEKVYDYTPANNGAGPLWCSGSTCLVRSGERVVATGLETIPDAKPLNNCRWVLFDRSAGGWVRVRTDAGRTREPAPIVAFGDGRFF